MIPSYLSPLANHLWQSTLFAAAVGFLTLAFRKNRASVRYGLWLAAPVKFLVPFSLLASLGSQIEWRKTPLASPLAFALAVDEVSRPFAPPVQTQATRGPRAAQDRSGTIPVYLWLCGFAVVTLPWARKWLRLRALLRSASPLDLKLPIKAMSSPSRIEPGVIGIFRPVLLIPEGIVDRLSPEQWNAILAHEMCHVARRDNLTAAIQMAVEALFWFHPLVWWIGSRLVNERERACDEAVLHSGSDREAYAEGILNVCKFYLESPLLCAAGVTGADLKKRMEEIMTGRVIQRLNFGKKLLLASAGLGAIAAPFVVGMMNGRPLRAQQPPAERLAFEVASIKENKSQDRRAGLQFLAGGRFVARNEPLLILILIAYHLPFQSPRITPGPDLDRGIVLARYDIEATAEKDAIPAATPIKVRDEKMRLMLQTLLADRFKMVVHRETKELPVYVITVAKGGPKLQKSAMEEKDCPDSPPWSEDPAGCHSLDGGLGRGIHGKAVSMEDLAEGMESRVDRPVLDKTGIQGLFNIQTEGWVPLQPRPPRTQEPTPEQAAEDQALADPGRPTLFQIFDRLGLKLESTKAPVEVFVIERLEKPSEN
jgi:bla regulator protein blaR1